jgi:hypothetical protein
MAVTAAEIYHTLTPANYNGQSGWWIFPQASWQPNAWYCKTDANNQLWVSPNEDFSTPVYAAKWDVDGYMKIYDQYLDRLSGVS